MVPTKNCKSLMLTIFTFRKCYHYSIFGGKYRLICMLFTMLRGGDLQIRDISLIIQCIIADSLLCNVIIYTNDISSAIYVCILIVV